MDCFLKPCIIDLINTTERFEYEDRKHLSIKVKMYLKNITIKNISSIKNLSIELPFKEDGCPKILIFVGANGSGKTILQSQIMDAFYEISSRLFDDVSTLSGLKRNFYKVSGGGNLREGEEKGFSYLRFIDNKSQYIEYLDKSGDIKKEDIGKEFSLPLTNEKEVTSFSKESHENLQSEWVEGVHFYQPAYRYEEPFWKNKPFEKSRNFEELKRFKNHLNKEIEIISSTKDNKSYLMDLVLDFSRNPDNNLDQVTWTNINNILKKVKQRDDIRFGIGPRGGYRVSIVEMNNKSEFVKILLPSIDNLSLGESMLVNLFINIIRHGDNPPKISSEIKGIVAIDEVDVHLHADLQNFVLPNLIKMFPKVQFILTTHSPLFLLGMKKIIGEESFEVRSMPNGEVITTEKFSEFENAYNLFKSTEKFEEDLKEKVIEIKKPMLYVEGPTDVKYIEKFFKLYDKTDVLGKINIEIIGENTGTGTKNSNNFALKNAKDFLKSNLKILSQKVLLLNDPEEKVENESFEDKLFIRKIPKNSNFPLQCGIENLFNSITIEKLRKQKEDCFESHFVGSEQKKLKILNGKKQEVCTWLCENGDLTDFEKFKVIFKIIEDTILPIKK